MLSALMNSRKTVAGVLTAFNKALDDLKQVEIESEAEATRHAQAILDAQAAHDAAIAEASKAREVASKLTSLVSPMIETGTLDDLRTVGEVK